MVWEKWIEGPHKAYATFPFIAAQGGLPIIVDGDLIGAIGVSGVKSFQDEQIAMTAIKAVFPDAKTARAGEENDAQGFLNRRGGMDERQGAEETMLTKAR